MTGARWFAGWCGSLATVAILGVASVATASGAVATGQRSGALTPGGDLSPAEIQRLFDAYTMVQAQDMLELDDEHYGRFVTSLRGLHEARRTAETERRSLLQELVRLTNQEAPEADDAAIIERLRALQEHDARTAADVRKAYDGIDEVLDVRQRAKFRIFEERIERRKFELLMRARQGNRPGPRPPRPPRY